MAKQKRLRVLFLDDRSKRFTAAMKRWKDDDLTIVCTAKECIKLISSEKFDEIHLDHDLNYDSFVTSTLPNTGMEVVRHIERYWDNFFFKFFAPNPPFFIIHTSNHPAGEEMVRRLMRCGLTRNNVIYQRFEYDD